MWPWIKRWRDWAVTDLWPKPRNGPQPQAMHYSFEKAGLTIDGQPIPWNAEAVVVECLLSPGPTRRRADFSLRLPDQEPIAAEFLRLDEVEERWRLFFRLPVPSKTTIAELVWRKHVMGRITLPVLSREDFLANLSLEMPTLAVAVGEQTVACQTYVSVQGRGLIASALLTSPTSLAPLTDLSLRVELREGEGDGPPAINLPVTLSSSQLRGRQALVTTAPPKFPRRVTRWQATWLLDNRPLAMQHIRSISRPAFARSLRVSETRFVTQDKAGHLRVERQMPPREQLDRVGPCFLVSSNEVGMAGLCTLEVRAQLTGGLQSPLLMEQEFLLTDGPTPFAPGTLDIEDLAKVTAFELTVRGRPLGVLPLSPVPMASFTAEGGYHPPPEFAWSPVAEEQLFERLGKLLEPRANGK